MNIKRISAIALSNRDFDRFQDKLAEACRWIGLAAGMGSDLAVLPEMINWYCGDGPDNPRAMTLQQLALDDWQNTCRVLLECASTHHIALTIPVLVREKDGLRNCFYLISPTGTVLGRYIKTYPTRMELNEGVIPGGIQNPIEWEGLKIGGGICFDLNFQPLFERQKAAGVDLFLCPSLFPGGHQANYYALSLQTPFVIAYPAWSRIIDCLGRQVVEGGYRHETLRFGFGVPVYTAMVNFDKKVFHLDGNQQKIETILRQYGSKIKLDFDQDNVRFALESLSSEFTVKDVVKTFQLQPIEEYLAQFNTHCHHPRAL
ncbi:MAG: carbon-nitrogen hydrolase family protein [Phycisphaerae bacterium]